MYENPVMFIYTLQYQYLYQRNQLNFWTKFQQISESFVLGPTFKENLRISKALEVVQNT